jgi:FkbM family methyltransferase
MPVEVVLDYVRRVINRYHPTAQMRCEKPVIGPLVTAFRKVVWRALGLEHAFIEKHRQLNVALSRLEIERLTRCYWQFRPGTLDRAIFDGVVVCNEYQLPDTFSPNDIVLDVGTHIGSFCLAAFLRGAGCVHGFEPEQQNYELASANLRPFADRVHIHHKAVWRSDRKGDKLFHGGSTMQNTAGGSVLFNTAGQVLDVAAFDDIVREVTENGRKRIRLVKMDCEGAEFPILLTSRTLHLIDGFCGEYHEINDGRYNAEPITDVARVNGVERFTIGELTKCLQRAGFTVRSERSGETALGHFYASRN